ncbi:uncharacterized protein LOC111011977 [Momordica charantia]|uniref:Uncharacterized protein LOC111011977 n=1 Tax=Momordica charantia TaxID=3673 RepID=A0A6J1CKH8_MOMCH|nr:uncharacterized protein LOC111011977 [Momordica charantia]
MEMVPKIPPSSYRSSNLTCLSHIGSTVKAIKSKLTPRQLSMFRKTIFGHLLDVELVLNGPLLHNLLLRELENSRADVITMDVLGNRVSFGFSEFCLITGLKDSRRPIRKDTSPKRLRKLYFDDKVDILLSEFEARYMVMQFEDDIDAVKISMLLFVELVLFGKDRTLKLDNSLLGVVDDLEVCCNYDWAEMSFEKTIKSLKRVLTKKGRDERLRKTYSLFGDTKQYPV